MAKTIWYISKYVAPSYAARACSRGFSLLREFALSGHRAVLITSDSNHFATAPIFRGTQFSEDVNGVRTVWLKTLKFGSSRSISRILSWLHFEWRIFWMDKRQLHPPDYIIVSSLSLLTVLSGLYLRWKYSCKLVFEVRDVWPLMLTATGGVSPRHPLVIFLGWVEVLGYRNADLIVGTMPKLDLRVADTIKVSRPVVCIPQGVDSEAADSDEPLEQEYLERYFPKGKFVVGYVGSLGSDNELQTLLDCARLMKADQGVHFLIIGDGHMKKTLEIANQDLKNVTFAPQIKRSKVQSALSRLDILYFSFHLNDLARFGQSLNKVIDYMRSARPVVASYGGYPSMINEADCGTFVPPADPKALCYEIRRFASLSQDERLAIGARGRAWLLRERGFDKLASDYLAALEHYCPQTSERP